MKRDQKSRRLKLMLFASLSAILLCAAFAFETLVSAQQRLGRPPSRRELESTPILPSGTGMIPEGTPLVIELDTKLSSGEARVGDRFLALIAVPVIDSAGRTVLEAGTRLEGHVTNVQKARWGHRSGQLGLSFDYIYLGGGGSRPIPIRGALISGRRRIDDEGNLRAGSAARRDIIITSGGATAGAGIGAVAGGGLLVGGGIGAAAGLTVALLMKGKDVVISPGDRFNLELVQRLPLRSSGRSSQGPITAPVPLQPRNRPILRQSPGYGQGSPFPYDTGSTRTGSGSGSGSVPIYDVRAERDSDGMVRVLVTAETQTSGWRIYTHHEQRGDTLDVRLRGVQSGTSGISQLSRPSAPMICVHDRNGSIRRVVVYGSNGNRYLTLGSGPGSAQAQPSQPGGQSSTPRPQPTRPRPGSGPSDGSSIDFGYPAYPSPVPSGGITSRPSSTSPLATQVSNQIETLRSNYASTVGLWINRDGSADAFGQRRTTDNERRVYESLSYMHNSARALAAPAITRSESQRIAQQLRSDTQTAQQHWQRVQSTGILSPDLDRHWRDVQGSVRTLIDASSR